MNFKMIYPERKTVTAEWIMLCRAADHVENGMIRPFHDVEDAIYILTDIGAISIEGNVEESVWILIKGGMDHDFPDES